MLVIRLLPQDSEHNSCLHTHITLTHVRSEVKLTVCYQARCVHIYASKLLDGLCWSSFLSMKPLAVAQHY